MRNAQFTVAFEPDTQPEARIIHGKWLDHVGTGSVKGFHHGITAFGDVYHRVQAK